MNTNMWCNLIVIMVTIVGALCLFGTYTSMPNQTSSSFSESFRERVYKFPEVEITNIPLKKRLSEESGYHAVRSTHSTTTGEMAWSSYDQYKKVSLWTARLYPANKVCSTYVIITTKRRFDVMITYLLRSLLGIQMGFEFCQHRQCRWSSIWQSLGKGHKQSPCL